MSGEEQQFEGEEQQEFAITTIRTVKLSGRPEDYHEWCGKFTALLPPGVAKDLIDPKSISATRLGQLKTHNDLLHRRLLLSTSLVAYSIVEGTDGDGRKAWYELQDKYAASSEARITELIQQLANMKYDIGTDIDEHILKAEYTQKQLARLDESISDVVLRALILNSLPPEYDTVKTILRSQREVTLADFKRHLRTFYDTNFNYQYKHVNGGGGFRPMIARAAAAHGNPSGPRDAAKWCNHHKSASHSDAECYAQQRLANKRAEQASDGSFSKPERAATRAVRLAKSGPTPGDAPSTTTATYPQQNQFTISVGKDGYIPTRQDLKDIMEEQRGKRTDASQVYELFPDPPKSSGRWC